MQPGVTVALATVWLAGAVGVFSATLHPSHPSLDQYSPQQPPKHHEVTQETRGHANSKLQDQKDLLTPRHNQTANVHLPIEMSNLKLPRGMFLRYGSSDRSYGIGPEQVDLNLSFKDGIQDETQSKDVAKFPKKNFNRKEFARQKDVLVAQQKKAVSEEEYSDDYDSFQDQGPGSIEVYKLDLFEEGSLFDENVSEKKPESIGTSNQLEDNILRGGAQNSNENEKTKIDENEKNTLGYEKNVDESNVVKDSESKLIPFLKNLKTRIETERDVLTPEVRFSNKLHDHSEGEHFGIGGVPELQVGCEGVEVSLRDKRSSSESNKDSSQNKAALYPENVVNVQFVYESDEDEDPQGVFYEERDELIKLKKLEQELQNPPPHRGDIPVHLYEEYDKEKLPVRGDLASAFLNGDWDVMAQREESLDTKDDTHRSSGRKLLSVSESAPLRRKRNANGDMWGYGEDEGIMPDDDENDRRRDDERRRDEERRREEERRRYEQRKRDEDRRREDARRRADYMRYRQEDEKKRDGHHHHHNHQSPEESRRIGNENSKGGNDQMNQEDPRRRHDERRRMEEEFRRNTSHRRNWPNNDKGQGQDDYQRREQERRNLSDERRRDENRRLEEHRRMQEQRRRPQEMRRPQEDRRRPDDERNRHWNRRQEEERRRYEEQRQRQEAERRRNQNNHQPSNLMRPGDRRPDPRHHENEKKLRNYIQTNTPIVVGVERPNDDSRRILEMRRDNQDPLRFYDDRHRGREPVWMEQKRPKESIRPFNATGAGHQESRRNHGPSPPNDMGHRRDMEESRRDRERKEEERRRADRRRIELEERRLEEEDRRRKSQRYEEERLWHEKMRSQGERMRQEWMHEANRRSQAERRPPWPRPYQYSNPNEKGYQYPPPGENSKGYLPPPDLNNKGYQPPPPLPDLNNKGYQPPPPPPDLNNKGYQPPSPPDLNNKGYQPPPDPNNNKGYQPQRVNQDYERDRQRLEEERRRNEMDRQNRVREHDDRYQELQRRQDSVRSMDEYRRRQEEESLNSLPVSATIIIRPGGSGTNSSSPVLFSRGGFGSEIDFPGINPNHRGIQAARFPAPATRKPPVKGPGPCIWAVIHCCPRSGRAASCFETLGCPGINWDHNHCNPTIIEAARKEVAKFYNTNQRSN